jgi:rhamnulokinase
MTAKPYLAFDLGAESARAIVGRLEDGRIHFEELHRFPTRSVQIHGRLYWDILYIFSEMQDAIAKFVRQSGPECAGIGVDTWGVDFGILGPSGELLQNPVAYRDHRTDGIIERAFEEILPARELYGRTGIQFLQFNTLFQLWALSTTAPEVLREAGTFLTVPDLLHYFLSGIAKCEYTEASTSAMLDVHTRDWDKDLISKFGVPTEMLPEIVPPGTVLGPVHPHIARVTGIGPATPIIVPCTHDTGSAVVAVPAKDASWGYLSCGTWSLLGAELPEPNTSDLAYTHNFTNEGGYGRTIRFLKNIMGLWVLQECRRAWERRGEQYRYPELTKWAAEAAPFQAVLNIDEPGFLNPDDMLACIADQCARTGQQMPETPGAITRSVLEGLALRYAIVVDQLEETIGRDLEVLHIVGGGTQNELLCQLTADATGIPAICGPIEATALGNLAVQMIAGGEIAGIAEARSIIAASSEMVRYEPRDIEAWQEAHLRFRSLFG